MKIAIRLLVTALILASVGFLIFYYLQKPDSNLSTFYELSDYFLSTEAQSLEMNIDEVEDNYASMYSSVSYSKKIEDLIDVNFNYYNSLLLYVSGVSISDQGAMDDYINSYENKCKEALRLAKNFNDYYEVNPTALGVKEAYINFMLANNEKLTAYYNMVLNMKEYVKNYAFKGSLPVNLNSTLIQIHLDYAKVIVENYLNKLSTYSENDLINMIINDGVVQTPQEVTESDLINKKLEVLENDGGLMLELNQFLNKYSLYENAPETNSANIRAFINAYRALEFKKELLSSTEKQNYISGLEGGEFTNANIVYNFISGDFGGLIEGGE